MNGRLLLALIRRPRGVALLALGLALAGLAALRTMPISTIPSVDVPTILVRASLPGASPETMASLVATPLEESLGTISGIRHMTSTSVEGATRIVIQFELDRSVSAAARDVQAAINTVRNRLPKDMPAPPVYQKINPDDAPIMFLAITSETQTAEQLFDLARRMAIPEITRQPGVGGAWVQGADRSAVRVRANLQALRAMGLDLGDVRKALNQTNSNSPKGAVSSASTRWAILANDQLTNAAAYRDLPIAARNGRIVTLGQVAEVVDAPADERSPGWFNGRSAIFVFVQRERGANMLETVASVRAVIPQLKSMMPSSVDIQITADRSDSVIPMIEDATFALALTTLAIALVVILALRDRVLAFVAVINVPLALLGTVLVMDWLGFSLNMISLGGLTVSIGLMVDDAIVVVENIQRLRSAGRSVLIASLRGTQEVTFTIIAITLALVATLAPLLVLSGPVGVIVSEFAVTVTTAVLISGVLSLTLTPALVARLAPAETADSSRARPVLQRYAASLRWTVDHPVLTVGASIAVAFAVVPLWAIVPKTFLPLQDTGFAIGLISARPDTSFSSMAERMQQAAGAISADPAVQSVSAYLGSDDALVSSTGRIYIGLKPVSSGRDSMPEVIDRLRGRLSGVAGIEASLQPIEDFRVGGREGTGSENQFTLRADNAKELGVWLPRVVERLRHLRSVKEIGTDQAAGGGLVTINVDREKLARLGGTQAQLNDALYSALGQRQVLLIDGPFAQVPVVLESKSANASDVGSIGDIFLSSRGGGQIPIPAVAQSTVGTSPLIVTRDEMMPAATISFGIAPGYALGDAVSDIDRATRELGLPGSIKAVFGGNAEQYQQGLFGQPLTFLLAGLAVYLVLGILYESFLMPLAILATLPVAALGSLLGLALCGLELSVVAFMGLLLVAGIMMKNAIILVNFAVAQQRQHGLAAAEAMFRAGTQRFRPILMTSIAALLGALPIAFATGLGSEFRQPLGVAVAGGLVVAQAVTLFTTPAIYILLDGFGRRIGFRLEAWGERLRLRFA